MRYFELTFPDGYSMVIKALREPTIPEAEVFVAEDMRRMGYHTIDYVTEWTREDAVTAFDFDHENQWPIFGTEGTK